MPRAPTRSSDAAMPDASREGSVIIASVMPGTSTSTMSNETTMALRMYTARAAAASREPSASPSLATSGARRTSTSRT
ncbi:MAG: hypothetical protein GIKADHBN_00837 [Phycisphaerales bacterium]|nr:hypothetical protein [Phycisphaerales bacterium]